MTECRECGRDIERSPWSMSGWRHTETLTAVCTPVRYALPKIELTDAAIDG